MKIKAFKGEVTSDYHRILYSSPSIAMNAFLTLEMLMQKRLQLCKMPIKYPQCIMSHHESLNDLSISKKKAFRVPDINSLARRPSRN